TTILSMIQAHADNKAVMKMAVSIDWSFIEEGSEAIRDDEELALDAVGTCSQAMECLGPKARDNKKVVLKALEKDGMAPDTFVTYVSSRLQQDSQVALALIKESKGDEVLQDLPYFQDNAEVVYAAIQVNPSNRQYASERLQEIFK